MRAPVRFPREFYLDVCREIVTKRRAYSIVPRIRLIRGILVGSYTGRGLLRRGGRIARKRVSKKRLTKGKLAWKIGYSKLEGKGE